MDMLVGSSMDLWGACRVWSRSEEVGRKNVISFVWRRNYVCEIHGLGERKRGR